MQTVGPTAVLKCMFGMAPMPMMVLPINRDLTFHMPAATIMDMIPFLNIMPFAMCMTPSNPMVAAATAAALGVLTPMPCIPIPVMPWMPPPAPPVLINGKPALSMKAKTMCAWGGVINQVFPGQVTTIIP